MLVATSISYLVRRRHLIKDFSFEFFPGKIYAILGPNGSGKSTLLKLLGGFLPPASGAIMLHHHPLAKQSRTWISQRISFIQFTPSVPYPFSVAEIVQMGQYCTFAKQANPIEACLKDVNALHLAERIFNTLSDGEKQRVLLAQALATNTDILLLDEPTSHLDVFQKNEMWTYLYTLGQRGKIVIVATHDLTASERFSDQAILLNQGICKAAGDFMHLKPSLSALFSNPY